MTNFFKLLTGLLTAVLFSALGVVLLKENLIWIALFSFVIAGVSAFVWWHPKNLSYRFLFPGMLCFLLFTIFPIIFSIGISLSNLGTGHFFSQDKATEIFLSETISKADALALPMKVFKREKAISVVIDDKRENPSNEAQYIATLTANLEDKDVKELSFKRASEKELQQLSQLGALSLKEVFNLRKRLEKVVFNLKGERLLYHRADKLIAASYRYQENKDGSLTDTLTNTTYFPDTLKGRFISKDGKSLQPGFYTFVGLANYIDIFKRRDFRETFVKVSLWTFVWALVSVILTFSLGMSLALFVNDKALGFKALYRNLLILPYSIPFFISVLVFKGMLNKDFGVINQVLATVGISAIPWLENGLWAKVSCLMVNLWLGFPYMFLLTTGILQSIPESVYEAAKIDGANKWQSFKSITLPMILSSITPLLIGSFAFNLGNFVGIYLLTGGGPAMVDASTPAGETDILISYTYRLAFEGAMGQQFGLASSMAFFIFIIVAILTAINFKIFNKEEEGQA